MKQKPCDIFIFIAITLMTAITLIMLLINYTYENGRLTDPAGTEFPKV